MREKWVATGLAGLLAALSVAVAGSAVTQLVANAVAASPAAVHTADAHANASKNGTKKHSKKKKKSLTRAQKLAKALKACKKDKSKAKRAACEKAAKKKYGAKAPTAKVITRTVEVPGPERRVEVPATGGTTGGGTTGGGTTGGGTTGGGTTTPELPKQLGEGPEEKGATKAVEHSGAEIPAAPAWTPTQLNAYPTGNWLNSEGGTTGDHFSKLKEITPANVSQLKGDWMTQLDNSGEASADSAESSPTEYNGVDYYVTGVDDVFAVSVASGKILWVAPGNIPPQTGPDICCGWDNRGLSIGEGRVYVGLLTGAIEALNQQTGKLEWRTEVGTPSEGLTITSAPLYYEGMIFIGPVGSEYGVRGFMEAFNAKTGAPVWKHYNIPAPGEFGHNTWPEGRLGTTGAESEAIAHVENNEWKHGGATNWNAPTVDPKRGLILYSTANAGNDDEGYYREGQNLWSVSMLALNYKTGELSWGYQQVHHDVWDYDSSQQPLMINVKVESGPNAGKQEEGIVQANKDGFAYFVEDEHGQPVYPIEEKPVPAKGSNKNYPTQPIPTMPPFYPQTLTAPELAEVQTSLNSALAAKEKSTGKKYSPITVEHGGYEKHDVFGAWSTEGETTEEVSSDALSGDNEAPSSYDPENGYYYVCSRKGLDYAYMTSNPPAIPIYTEGGHYEGTPFLAAAHIGTQGYLTAYNMKTGQMAWIREWSHECYSGITTTAGNLLITGNVEGEMLAYNATTGEEVSHFQLGAAIGGPESVYEFEGKERIGVMAGGNSFNFTSKEKAPGNIRGDSLWQLSLVGTKGPVEPAYDEHTHAPQNVPGQTTDY